MNAFITGSHAYGTPHGESDIDLVVYMDSQQFDLLVASTPPEAWVEEGEDGQYMTGSACLRFGTLNLIVLRNKSLYDAWKAGTDELVSRKPVTREQAVEILQAKREAVRTAEAADTTAGELANITL